MTCISVQPNGECLCDFCPDGSAKRRCEEPECPCTCPGEEEEKEMGEDGTCPCECECEDGSMQQLDSAGHCPCECECMNCQQSTIGPEGCICPEDTCPECEPGTSPRWVDCECTCDEEECGFPPSCAEGRKGPNCDEPNCIACPSCSGNGVCTKITGECASTCSCEPRWSGGKIFQHGVQFM